MYLFHKYSHSFGGPTFSGVLGLQCPQPLLLFGPERAEDGYSQQFLGLQIENK